MDLPKLTSEETCFIERTRFYAVRVAQSVFRGDRRAFGLTDVVQVAYVAMIDAAIAWKRRTGGPACDYRFIKFAGVRIRHACHHFMISNERAIAISESSLRHARGPKATAATRDAALKGGRAVGLALARFRHGVRRGRVGTPIGYRSKGVRMRFREDERQAVRAALAEAAAAWHGPRRRAAELIISERLPFRDGYQLRAAAIGELAGGLRRKQVEGIQGNLLARAWRSLNRSEPSGARPAGGAIADANTGTLASAGAGPGGPGRADSQAGVSGGVAVGAA